MKPLRTAVIGLGHLGRHHARILRQLPGSDLVAMCDLDPAKFDQPECPQDVFRTHDPAGAIALAEAVVVAVPTLAHASVGGAALAAGCHVLIEKPLAPTPGAGRDLVASAEAHGVLLMTGHVERFNGAFRALDGQLNRTTFVEGHRLSAFTARSLDVDVVLDLMVHDLDLLLRAVGRDVVSVEAVGVPVLSSRVDIASARLTFEGGCVANLTASRVSGAATRKLRFFDTESYWSLDFVEQQADVARLERPADAPPRVARERRGEKGEPLRLELEDFLGACRARVAGAPGAPRGASGSDGLRALELAFRVREAMQAHAHRHGGPIP